MNEFQLFLFTYPMFQLFFLKNKPFLVKNFYLNFAKKGSVSLMHQLKIFSVT